MAVEPRITTQTLKVLGVLMEAPGRELAGSQVAVHTGLQSGTLYPILLRLENAGWLSSRWESEEATDLGRPKRRFYKVTALGVTKAHEASRELTPFVGRLAWE